VTKRAGDKSILTGYEFCPQIIALPLFFCPPAGVSKNSCACNNIGFSIIISQQAAKPVATMGLVFRRKLQSIRPDDFILQPLMIPFSIVMRNKLLDRSPK
jgi:hypothetical protein